MVRDRRCDEHLLLLDRVVMNLLDDVLRVFERVDLGVIHFDDSCRWQSASVTVDRVIAFSFKHCVIERDVQPVFRVVYVCVA